MRHTFHSEQWLPYPVDLVFAFFANPENLPRLMPSWQKARIEEASFVPPPPRLASLDSSLPLQSIAAGIGTCITLSFRPFPFSPVRVRWEAKIDEFVWNNLFADLQLKGPFSYWHHRHTIRAETRITASGASTSGSLLRDDVEYEMPLGKLGEVANTLFIARQLHTTFAFRHTRTRELLTLTYHS